ncbi:PREDICTED: uncharacterized protein LOC109215764 [Nicotiana attenuata]|uniref:uncharacterized protein LOC109215764 n=1 Tax=Nicotiana attenuata TaxID=49451 RepID=UPI000904BC18|nr:PREDICTED: uncharacterized protein LOC109215764 [Nicotiana attenuata]
MGPVSQAKVKYGIGGVFRNIYGNWIIRFAGTTKEGSTVQTELLALLMGLKIAVQMQLKSLTIETDAQAIIGMFNAPPIQYTNIINDCRLLLLQLDNPPLQHIYREQNSVADSVATYGAMHLTEQCSVFERPPLFAMSSYIQNHQGMLQRRLIRTDSTASA